MKLFHWHGQIDNQLVELGISNTSLRYVLSLIPCSSLIIIILECAVSLCGSLCTLCDMPSSNQFPRRNTSETHPDSAFALPKLLNAHAPYVITLTIAKAIDSK
jgi:hypothetical protein